MPNMVVFNIYSLIKPTVKYPRCVISKTFTAFEIVAKLIFEHFDKVHPQLIKIIVL